MNIAFIIQENNKGWYSHTWRFTRLADAINQKKLHHAKLYYSQEILGNPELPIWENMDLLIFQGELAGTFLSLIQHWKAHCITVVADVHQPLFEMPAPNEDLVSLRNLERLSLINGEINAADQLIDETYLGIKLVDGLTISQKNLENAFYKQSSPVAYVPDYINLDEYSSHKTINPDEFVIGWAGSYSDYEVWEQSGLSQSLNEILKNYPHVKLQLSFYSEKNGYNDFDSDHPQRETHWNVSQQEWLTQLNKIDIGILPQTNAPHFNYSRYRLLEFMKMKIPWIASRQEEIYDLGQFGSIVGNCSNEWYKGITWMIENYDTYKTKAATRPYWYSLGQNLSENIENVITIYHNFVKSIPA